MGPVGRKTRRAQDTLLQGRLRAGFEPRRGVSRCVPIMRPVNQLDEKRIHPGAMSRPRIGSKPARVNLNS